jgi:hypothetical protein
VHVSLIDDDDLTAEALAADPDAPVGADAISFWSLQEREAPDLPEWYMAAPMTSRPHLTGWKRRVALTLIIAFVLINAAGMCSTYGWPSIA